MPWLRAPAKLNLTLRVVGRRADGYHELESLVAFAGLCDWLGFDPGDDLMLEVFGPRAGEAGPVHENLVVRAARSLATQIPGLRLGRFRLIKRLPAAAGLGGGSADAAAALRLLATEVGLPLDDPRVLLRLERPGRTFLLVFLHKPERSGVSATSSGQRFDCRTPLWFWSIRRFRCRRRRFSLPLALRPNRTWNPPLDDSP